MTAAQKLAATIKRKECIRLEEFEAARKNHPTVGVNPAYRATKGRES